MTTEAPNTESMLDLWEKAVILLGGVLAAFAMTVVSAVLPKIELALAHGPTDAMLVKQLIGGVGLSMVVGAPLAGVLVNRLGLGRMLAAASIIYILAGTAGLYLSDLRMLLASRLVLGLAASAIQITSLTLINTRLAGQARAKWLGVNVGVASISTIAMQPVAGTLGEIGWRAPFALYLIGLAMLPAALHIRARLPVPSLAPAAPSARDNRGGILSWFPLSYLPFAICIGTLVFLPAIYTPFLLRQVGVASPTVISLVLTADAIASSRAG